MTVWHGIMQVSQVVAGIAWIVIVSVHLAIVSGIYHKQEDEVEMLERKLQQSDVATSSA